MNLTPQQQKALAVLVSAVLDTVKNAGPLGAPAGPMYAALMAQGCTLNQFESLMGALVRRGLIRHDGDCYHMVRS